MKMKNMMSLQIFRNQIKLQNNGITLNPQFGDV